MEGIRWHNLGVLRQHLDTLLSNQDNFSSPVFLQQDILLHRPTLDLLFPDQVTHLLSQDTHKAIPLMVDLWLLWSMDLATLNIHNLI